MPRKYPWEKWLGRLSTGKKLRLRRGKHFKCMPHSMSVMVRQWAAKSAMSVSVRIDDQGNLTVEESV